MGGTPTSQLLQVPDEECGTKAALRMITNAGTRYGRTDIAFQLWIRRSVYLPVLFLTTLCNLERSPGRPTCIHILYHTGDVSVIFTVQEFVFNGRTLGWVQFMNAMAGCLGSQHSRLGIDVTSDECMLDNTYIRTLMSVCSTLSTVKS